MKVVLCSRVGLGMVGGWSTCGWLGWCRGCILGVNKYLGIQFIERLQNHWIVVLILQGYVCYQLPLNQYVVALFPAIPTNRQWDAS